MGLILNHDYGQTPLDEDEIVGLRIQTISTKEELDEYEQKNIEEAVQWLIGKSFSTQTIFTEQFICNLHKRMYGDVWNWAGQLRKTNKNLGIDPWKIATSLKLLCDDANYWTKHKSYVPDEIAIRFKHKIVSIHCFNNGNGRHSRLMADVIIEKIFNGPFFSWGANDIIHQDHVRKKYLNSIKEADKSSYTSLLEFARS